MIRQQKRWMQYTYFNRQPDVRLGTTHLFALAEKSLFGMIRESFPTMTVDIRDENFLDAWSSSCRTKIRKAEQEALDLIRDRTLLKEVLDLFRQTALRKGIEGYDQKHFDSFPQIAVTGVRSEEKLMCGHVWLVDPEEKRALFYVNASRFADAKEDAAFIGRAHYYLLYQDGLYLREMGIDTLDLMGYDPEKKDPKKAGVYQWKAATRGTQECVFHYYPIWFYVLRKIRNILPR